MDSNTVNLYSLEELSKMKEGVLGSSGWQPISQEMVNAFASLTGDNQEIHLATPVASQLGYDAPIVQGFFLVSCLPMMLRQVVRVADAKKRMNLGLSDLRFLRPVKVGSSVRASFALNNAKLLHGALHTTLNFMIEAVESAPVEVATGNYKVLFYLNS